MELIVATSIKYKYKKRNMRTFLSQLTAISFHKQGLIKIIIHGGCIAYMKLLEWDVHQCNISICMIKHYQPLNNYYCLKNLMHCFENSSYEID